MSELYCDGDDMADLASSVYPASSAALGGACPALSAVPIFPTTWPSGRLPSWPDCCYPYIGGTSDADVVLKVLNLETDAAYTDFLDRKLVEWYASAHKSDSHQAPVHEDDNGEVSEAGRARGGVRAETPSVQDALNGLIKLNTPLQRCNSAT